MTTGKVSLAGLDLAAIKSLLADAGVEAKAASMRARQLYNWIYVHGACEFAAMTNLAKDFREQMAERFQLARPAIVTEQVS